MKGIGYFLLAPVLISVPTLTGGHIWHKAHVPRKEWVAVTLPSATVSVGSEQEGAIADLPVSEGDVVKEGQVLFKLTTLVQELEVQRLAAIAESDAPIRQAKAELQRAERDEQRAISLHRQEIAGDAELDEKKRNATVTRIRLEQARVEQRVAQLRCEEAKARLAQRTVKSPINGYVGLLHHRRGETVPKLEPVLVLVRLDPLWVEFDCPIEDEEFFRAGTKVWVRRDRSAKTGVVKASREAKVVYAAPMVNAASQTFRVRLEMKNAGQAWKGGLKVWIESLEEDR